jgi:hypothetical protein
MKLNRKYIEGNNKNKFTKKWNQKHATEKVNKPKHWFFEKNIEILIAIFDFKKKVKKSTNY